LLILEGVSFISPTLDEAQIKTPSPFS